MPILQHTKLQRALVIAISLVTATPSFAENVGVFGTIYPIAEKDGVDQIKDRIRGLQKGGALDAQMASWRTRVMSDISHPPPVPGIITGFEPKTRTIDLTYTFPSDVRDPLGKVMVRAGTRVNPLAGLTMANEYLFIDGRDFEQITIAKQFVQSDPVRHRVVLVAGDYNALADQLGVKVYYDQKGLLTKAFSIRQVPARIYQTGQQITVSEGRP